MRDYLVLFYQPDSPIGLLLWLENQLQDGWELVACSGEYFIFRPVKGSSTDG
jgi:hypothetical protein